METIKGKRRVKCPGCNREKMEICPATPMRYTGSNGLLFDCEKFGPPLDCPHMLCGNNRCIMAAKVKSENGYYVFPCDECILDPEVQAKEEPKGSIYDNPKGSV